MWGCGVVSMLLSVVLYCTLTDYLETEEYSGMIWSDFVPGCMLSRHYCACLCVDFLQVILSLQLRQWCGWPEMSESPLIARGMASWCSLCRCAYVLVCELDENSMQADSILTAIIKLVVEHVTSHEQRNAEVTSYSSQRMIALLN